ncbi:hypothetical protein PoB_000455300 [Plakobranchus ocellatus]|uniref:Uncharacterized protein n=1 Tax=Plakobranchus ocellatus TaxID=259542 RepID=A0AAV3Y664_9GAST|nr:hypothetical protein PoB_000455300 [Plakobranchus ocellatus]
MSKREVYAFYDSLNEWLDASISAVPRLPQKRGYRLLPRQGLGKSLAWLLRCLGGWTTRSALLVRLVITLKFPSPSKIRTTKLRDVYTGPAGLNALPHQFYRRNNTSSVFTSYFFVYDDLSSSSCAKP